MKNAIILIITLILLGCKTKIPDEFILDEKDLVPEGIAYSETKDVFYLSSIAKSKIIEWDRKTGRQIDFIKEREFGYSPGAGIYVDDEQNLLHAIGGYYMSDDSLSSLFSFDLNTKKLLKRYNASGKHFLNDMTKDRKGNIYLTDTKGSAIFLLQQGNDSLELFFESHEIQFPNGITISDDNTKLYIASATKGVRILNISTKNILNKKDTLKLTQGIDGLEFYNNNLYAIQNGVKSNTDNFRKLILNETQDQIINVKVIDSNTPKLNIPLTFCFAQDKAVVIGNSNLQYLNQETFEFANADTIPRTKLLIYRVE